MAEIGRQFAGSAVAPRRVAGVDGAALPAAEAARLTGDPGAPRGTLGCFLGHARAWSALLAGDDDCALVVEDDVMPLLDLPPRLGGLGLPAGWDLAFVNDRLEPSLPVPPGAADGVAAWPLAAALRAFHPDDNAPGADGYLLTRSAARRLLDWTAADGVAGDVDWRLLAYGLTPADVAALPDRSHARAALGRLQSAIPRPERLRACALSPALIRTVGVSSDREDANRGPPA